MNYSSIDHVRAVFFTHKKAFLFRLIGLKLDKVCDFAFKKSLSFDSALIHFGAI